MARWNVSKQGALHFDLYIPTQTANDLKHTHASFIVDHGFLVCIT